MACAGLRNDSVIRLHYVALIVLCSLGVGGGQDLVQRVHCRRRSPTAPVKRVVCLCRCCRRRSNGCAPRGRAVYSGRWYGDRHVHNCAVGAFFGRGVVCRIPAWIGHRRRVCKARICVAGRRAQVTARNVVRGRLARVRFDVVVVGVCNDRILGRPADAARAAGPRTLTSTTLPPAPTFITDVPRPAWSGLLTISMVFVRESMTPSVSSARWLFFLASFDRRRHANTLA